MEALTPAGFLAIIMWCALIAFAVFGGADFGAGFWDVLAKGEDAERQRVALIRAIGPIWEANEIWLIFLLTGVWTGFPIVFSTLMTALFVPLVLGLLGIVMRGASFAFYTHARLSVRVGRSWGRSFSGASIITPFFFGAAAAADASGNLHVDAAGNTHANLFNTWANPFGIACGLLAISFCAVLAATFMTVEARRAGDHKLVMQFRARALIAGAVTAVIGTVAAWLGSLYAPYFFDGLTTRALPLALAGVVIGALTGASLLLGFFLVARALVSGMVALILGAWAIAQYPYLVVPDITITSGAAPHDVVVAVLIAAIVSSVLVFPSLFYMFRLFKAGKGETRGTSTEDFIHQIAEEEHLAALEQYPEVERKKEKSPVMRTVEQRAKSLLPGAAALGAIIVASQLGKIVDAMQRHGDHEDHKTPQRPASDP